MFMLIGRLRLTKSSAIQCEQKSSRFHLIFNTSSLFLSLTLSPIRIRSLFHLMNRHAYAVCANGTPFKVRNCSSDLFSALKMHFVQFSRSRPTTICCEEADANENKLHVGRLTLKRKIQGHAMIPSVFHSHAHTAISLLSAVRTGGHRKMP